jgi:FixJ family two-component response regulator
LTTTTPSLSGHALRIGIVDDDDDLRRALRRLLIASGFEVAAYASGEAFLAAGDAVDCVILDVHLGGMTGLEVYRQLKETQAPPPVVFITAHYELLGEIESMGTPCLPKPFDEQALVDAIARARRAA